MKIFESLLLALFLLLGLCCAFGATEPVFSLQKDYLGAAGYPRLVGSLLAAFCLVALLRLWLTRRASAPGAPGGAQLRHMAAAVSLAVAYVAGIVRLGFLISTFIYLCSMPVFLGSGSGRAALLRNLLYAGLVTGVIQVFFTIFKIYLPAALLF